MTLTLARPPIERTTEDEDTDRSDGELLAALVHQGETLREARARAGLLLELAGGPRGLLRLAKSQLAGAGLSDDSIARLKAAMALGARIAAARVPVRPLDATHVAAIFRPLLAHLAHEEMHVLLLDARGCYLSRTRIASGGVSACSVYLKEILAPAVEARAARFFIVHNHPSGISRPSPEDLSLTTRVASASELLGITLVDHLVVADDGFSSAFPSRRSRSAP
jgi:DNA repair protein RadC